MIVMSNKLASKFDLKIRSSFVVAGPETPVFFLIGNLSARVYLCIFLYNKGNMSDLLITTNDVALAHQHQIEKLASVFRA
jgi:hypothetical protein